MKELESAHRRARRRRRGAGPLRARPRLSRARAAGRGAARARARVAGRLSRARGLVRARPRARPALSARARRAAAGATTPRPRRCAAPIWRAICASRRWRISRAPSGCASEAPEYVEGLIALHERRWTQALDKARAAQERVPLDVRGAHARGRHPPDARPRSAGSTAAPTRRSPSSTAPASPIARAAEIARSSASALHGDCLRWVMAAEILSEHERSPVAAVDGAMAACRARARRRCPATARSGPTRSTPGGAWRSYQSNHNGDPRPAWTQAERARQARQGARAEQRAPARRRSATSTRSRQLGAGQRRGSARRASIAPSTPARAALARDAQRARGLSPHERRVAGARRLGGGARPRSARLLRDDVRDGPARAGRCRRRASEMLNTIGLGYLSRGHVGG